MQNFIVYNMNGQILRSGRCQIIDLPLQAQTGESLLLDVTANDSLQYVDTATLALVNFPAQPSDYHAWDWPTKTWLTPSTALAQAQSDQQAVIDSAYTAANVSNIAYMGATFQADQASQTLLSSVITACGGALPAGFLWYDITNIGIAMTYAQLQGLAGTILMRGQALFTHKQVKKAEIRATTTIAQAQGVVW